jgi:hypothetical protein
VPQIVIMRALQLYQSCQWPPDLYSWYPLVPKRRSPDVCVSEWGPGLTLTQNMSQGLLLHTTPPTHRAINQPHQEEVPSQGVVSGEKASYHPGLSPGEGQFTPTHYKIHTYTHPHITKPTHTHTHTLQNPHIHTPTHYKTHTHYKTS